MPWKELLAWATGPIEVAPNRILEFALDENCVHVTLLDRHLSHRLMQNAERKVHADEGHLLGELLDDVITFV